MFLPTTPSLALLQVLALLQTANAFQLPFKLPFITSQPAPSTHSRDPPPPRIAIVGAGPGGSSAAYWIALAKQRYDIDNLQVDVYDSESYIGGRSTVAYPYDDTSFPPVELGASVFVKANKNLYRASDEFNMTRIPFKGEDYSGFGLWDGASVILEVTNSWWDYPKLLWRYGFKSPRSADNLVKSMIDSYLSLYSPSPPRWDNITTLASTLQWTDIVSQSTLDYLESHSVSTQFTRELVEAATRANYAQNTDTLHALEGLVSLAATDVSSIKGGNYQLFEQFLLRSGANVHLNSTVTRVAPSATFNNYWDVRYKTPSGSMASTTYKAVILAFPLSLAPADIIPAYPDLEFPATEYVKLHTTLLATTSPRANATFLSRNHPASAAGAAPANGELPRSLYTTTSTENADKLEFTSLSYLTELNRDNSAGGEDASESSSSTNEATTAAQKEWIVKIFSHQEISDDWLKSAFNDQVGWVQRKAWDAYPVGKPTTKFAPVRIDKGLFYVNGFETFISTMETSTIASRNVVDLLLNEEFEGAGVCRRSLSADDTQDHQIPQKVEDGSKEFVFGWDC